MARIEKLESDNRRTKWASLGLILLLVALVLVIAFRISANNKLELTELTIKDASGTVIARLGEDRRGTCLELNARSGASRAALCADMFYGSNLDLKNQHPETRASLSAGRKLYENGGDLVPGLLIEGEDGQSMFSVNVGGNPEAFLGHSPSDSSLVLGDKNQQ